MSETPQNETQHDEKKPLDKGKKVRTAAFVFLGIVALMLVILIIMSLVGRHSSDAAKDSSASAAGCNVPVSDGGDEKAVRPDDIKYKTTSLKASYPVSKSVGPTKEDHGVPACYSHSQMGAVMSVAAAAKVGFEPEGTFPEDAVDRMTVNSKDGDNSNGISDEAKPNYDMKIVGYRVLQYSPEKARINLLYKITDHDSGSEKSAEADQVVRWEDGDWKWDNSHETQFQPATVSDFTSFEGGALR